jgi:hypothetical protein
VTPEAAQADRAASVRAAARAWQRAGAIDGAALAAIEAAWPDDRHRVGPVFRVLLFLFTLIAVNGAFGFVWAVASAGFRTDRSGFLAGLGLAFGIAFAVATDLLTGPARRAQSGVEAATSFAGLGFLTGFAAWAFAELAGLKTEPLIGATLVTAAVLLAAAAWRWGYPLYAGAAVAALLGSLTVLPGGRLAWIVLPLAAGPFLVHGSESPQLSPAHRAGCAAALGVALAGLYLAVHLGSFDSGLIELHGLGGGSGPAWPGNAVRGLSIAATALVPVVYLALGLRSRRYVFLLLGTATAVASLVTLRVYVHLAPVWAMITASGALLLGVAFAIRRFLASGPEGERGGFTAEPLFEDPGRQRALEAAAAVLSLSPEARPLHEEPRFTGEGGQFGGGGSSSEF